VLLDMLIKTERC